jgi:hypothetical protein
MRRYDGNEFVVRTPTSIVRAGEPKIKISFNESAIMSKRLPPSKRRHREFPDRAIAMHEASHAVVSTHLGIEFKYCDIRFRQLSSGKSRGVTNVASVRNQDIIGKGPEAVMPLLTVLMAGSIGESRVSSVAPSLTGKTDLEMAQRLAAMAICENTRIDGERGQITDEELQAKEPVIQQAIALARSEAIRLIEENISAIEHVTDLLLRQGRVSAREVASIVNRDRGDTISKAITPNED